MSDPDHEGAVKRLDEIVEVLLNRQAAERLRRAAQERRPQLPANLRKRLEKARVPADRSAMSGVERRGMSGLERSGDFLPVRVPRRVIELALDEASSQAADALEAIARACDATWNANQRHGKERLDAAPIPARREANATRITSVVRGGAPGSGRG